MTANEIYVSLVRGGLSPIGACAMLGNMQAESAMRANNAQDGCSILSDEQYTAAVDNGSYTNFVHDEIGYGLCQWTFWSRKENLLRFVRRLGVSISDASAQVSFVLWELQNEHSRLWTYLQSATGLYEASSRICLEYEQPAINNVEERAQYANQFYCQFGGMDIGSMPAVSVLAQNAVHGTAASEIESGFELTNETVMHLQAILVTYGYAIGTKTCPSGVDGYIGRKTVEALKQFTARLEGLI